jgi:Dna[CI] antecedent, DciA
MTRAGRRFGALEPLGTLLRRDTDLRVPAAVETSPIAFRDWEAAVGSRIAARARPVRLERGVLTVRTATATWAQELSMLADAILAQLRGRSVDVQSLRFRVGPVEAPDRPPSRSEVRTSPPEVPLPLAVRQEVDRVADPDLRAAIALAAAKNLGWQSTLEQPPPPPKPPRAAKKAAAPAATSAATSGAAPAATSARRGARGPRSA